MLRKALYLKWTGAVGTGVAGIASALPVAARTMARAIGGARRGGRAGRRGQYGRQQNHIHCEADGGYSSPASFARRLKMASPPSGAQALPVASTLPAVTSRAGSPCALCTHQVVTARLGLTLGRRLVSERRCFLLALPLAADTHRSHRHGRGDRQSRRTLRNFSVLRLKD